jgi:hypothetical protein
VYPVAGLEHFCLETVCDLIELCRKRQGQKPEVSISSLDRHTDPDSKIQLPAQRIIMTHARPAISA